MKRRVRRRLLLEMLDALKQALAVYRDGGRDDDFHVYDLMRDAVRKAEKELK